MAAVNLSIAAIIFCFLIARLDHEETALALCFQPTLL